jgi:hypothetical protein
VLHRLTHILVLLCLVSAVTMAQATRDYNKGEFFAGYSGALQSEDFQQTSPLENGFNFAAVYNIRRYIGLKFDVSGTFKSVEGPYTASTPGGIVSGNFHADHSSYHVLGGVQFKNNSKDAQIKPFAHVLVGLRHHQDNFTSTCPAGAVCRPFNTDFDGFATVLGGGVDVKLNRRIDIRVIQADLSVTSARTAGSASRSIFYTDRLSAGIVFKF